MQHGLKAITLSGLAVAGLLIGAGPAQAQVSAPAVPASPPPSSAPAAAAPTATPQAAPPSYQAVINCRAIAEPTARLACFDQTVGVLAESVTTRQVLVVDKAMVRETKRSLFGIALPKLRIFGPDNDEEEVDQIASTIQSLSETREGLSIFGLADGSRWRQTEGRYMFPKVGQPIVVKRASLGGYMAKVNGQIAVRVVRIINP